MDTFRSLTIDELLFESKSFNQVSLPNNTSAVNISPATVDTVATLQVEKDFNTRIMHFIKRYGLVIGILGLVGASIIYIEMYNRNQKKK
jgi:hypothetical protein